MEDQPAPRTRRAKPVAVRKQEADAAVAALTGTANPTPPGGEIPPMPEPSASLARVVERVFSVDVGVEYERLEADLTLHDALNPQAVRVALNRAESNALTAHRVFVVAKVELERFEIQAMKVSAAMRNSAVEELSSAKSAGLTSKQITEADVKAKSASLYPDQFEAHALGLAHMKRTVDNLERLADLWKSRCHSLNKLAE